MSGGKPDNQETEDNQMKRFDLRLEAEEYKEVMESFGYETEIREITTGDGKHTQYIVEWWES